MSTRESTRRRSSSSIDARSSSVETRSASRKASSVLDSIPRKSGSRSASIPTLRAASIIIEYKNSNRVKSGLVRAIHNSRSWRAPFMRRPSRFASLSARLPGVRFTRFAISATSVEDSRMLMLPDLLGGETSPRPKQRRVSTGTKSTCFLPTAGDSRSTIESHCDSASARVRFR